MHSEVKVIQFYRRLSENHPRGSPGLGSLQLEVHDSLDL